MKKYRFFFRPFLHRFRRLALKVLGLHHWVDSLKSYLHNSESHEADETLQRLTDRIAVLESHVNWRLYGLPATVANMRMELQSVLYGHMSLDNLIKDFSQFNANAQELAIFQQALDELSEESQVAVIGSYNLFDERGQPKFRMRSGTNIFVIVDASDLRTLAWKAAASENIEVIVTKPSTFLSVQSERAYDLIFLSDYLTMSHALQQLMILNEAKRALKSNGKALGLVVAPTHNLHPFFEPPLAYLRSKGFRFNEGRLGEGIIEF